MIRVINLNFLDAGNKAIVLIKNLSFEVEDILEKDKILYDGHFHNTILVESFNG